MNYAKIVVSLALILSVSPQFVSGHGKMAIFAVHKNAVGASANAKRVANVLAPSNDDYIDYFVSDEKVTVHLPKEVATHGKVEVTKKDIAKTLLIARAFVSSVKHNIYNKTNPLTLKRALVVAAKDTVYDVAKDQAIGAVLDATGSQMELPDHVKKHYLFNAACFAAGKVAGYGLNIAIDKSYNAGKKYIFG